METGYFFQQLSMAHYGALILDFESTLAKYGPARTPRFCPSIDELLDCILTTTRTRLIVTSSRPTQQLAALFAPPRPEIWGWDLLERLTPAPAAPDCTRELLQVPIEELRARCPVAYVSGTRYQAPTSGRPLVRPELHLSHTRPVLAPPEDFIQFLLDWLRACAGEVC
jgi:hypothetical protein